MVTKINNKKKSKSNNNSNLQESISVVKINPKLLKEVKEFIEKDKNQIRFANKKQFIDLAVYGFLNKLKKEKEE